MKYTARQLAEIRLALFYKRLDHGTDGHNRLLLIAQMATQEGFTLDEYTELRGPDGSVIFTDKEEKNP